MKCKKKMACCVLFISPLSKSIPSPDLYYSFIYNNIVTNYKIYNK